VFDRVRFVLVHPRSGGNVGSAARAIKNLGFSRLALVAPSCDPLGREARMMAVDARDVLERAEKHRDLDEALAGSGTVVGTSRRLGRHRRPHWRLDEIAERLAGLALAGELAVLFGREDRGLTDAELDRCTHLVYLPASEIYPSFNLAQAVLLVAYELRMATLEEPLAEPLGPPAGHGAREAMYHHLERALLAIGFLGRDTREVIMRRFRRVFGRAVLTPDEVKMLRGVARQTLWAAKEAGLEIPPARPEEAEGRTETERDESN